MFGLVPVKRLSEAKTRLVEAYGEPGRAAIARALLEDALDLCLQVPDIDWHIVSDDPEVLGSARQRRLPVIEDAGTGLNPALAIGIAMAISQSADAVLVLPSDLPLARSDSIQDVVDTAATSDVVVVPAGRDGGTNALVLDPPNVIEPRFGSDSLTAHIAAAESRGLRCAILASNALALDIDTPDDVRAYLARASLPSNRTTAALRAFAS